MTANYEHTESSPDFHGGPTSKMIRVPKQCGELAVISTVQEPGRAWPPFLVFLIAFMAWSWMAVWAMQNVNAILYVLVLWNR